MQIDDTRPPQQGQEQRRRSPEKILGTALAIAMALTGVVVVPFFLSQTIGVGNYGLFFVAMILGLFLGDRWTLHVIGLGMLISGWVSRATLIYAIIGAFVVRGAGYSPRLKWDSRKRHYSGAYAATYEDGLPGSTALGLYRYTYLFAGILVITLALVVAVMSSAGMADWLARLAAVTIAIMFVKVVASYLYSMMMLGPKDPASLERASAYNRLASDEARGVRPGDFDASLIESLVSIPDGSIFELGGWLIAAERALDLDDLDEAERAMTRATLIASPLHGSLESNVYRAAAFLAAYRDNDAAAARIWLSQASAPSIEEHTEARIDAAILLAEGELEQARTSVVRGIAALDRSILPGAAALDEKLLHEILNRIDAASTPTQIAS